MDSVDFMDSWTRSLCGTGYNVSHVTATAGTHVIGGIAGALFAQHGVNRAHLRVPNDEC